jgi:hypothetical protein
LKKSRSTEKNSEVNWKIRAVNTNIKEALNFVYYPETKEGEFLSLSLMQFSDIIKKSKDWNEKTPYVPENELFMNTDLTENDLVIR